MIYERLRVFVSSKMVELAAERRAIERALDELNIDAWTFEEDAGARPESVRETFLEQVEASDLFLGLFWRGYGEYTIDEFEYARRLGKDCLLYEKREEIDGTRDPRLQEFLTQIGDVESGLTSQWFRTPVELSEMVKRDAQRWQLRIVRRYREQAVRAPTDPADVADRRALALLRGKVRDFWIDGVLNRSIHGARVLELGKETRPDAIDQPWEAVLELPFEGTRVVPAGQGILELFDEVRGSLLILGQPGSGKTTTLLELARLLLDRAEREPTEPVPVVLHLSTWRGGTLMAWLIEELSGKYQVPREMARRWVTELRLLPLLDGLDEVEPDHRAGFVEAIGAFMQEHGLPGLAVTCRVHDYSVLPVRLRTNGAVSLQPLSPDQIDAYLAQGGDRLDGLRAAMSADPVLRELARSPLMLSIMGRAYEGASIESLASRADDAEELRRQHLFESYVARMFERQGREDGPYDEARTRRFLGWLAANMARAHRSVFLVEELQPEWVGGRAARATNLVAFAGALGSVVGVIGASTWHALALISADSGAFVAERGYGTWVVACSVWALVVGIIDLIRPAPSEGRGGIVGSFLLNLLGYGVAWLVVWKGVEYAAGRSGELLGLHRYLFLSLVGPLLVAAKGARFRITRDVRTVESLGLSGRGMAIGAMFGALAGAGIWVLFRLGPEPDVRGGHLGFLAVFVVLATIAGASFRGLESRFVPRKTRPNEGVRLSLRNGITAALLPSLMFSAAVFLLGSWVTERPEHRSAYPLLAAALLPIYFVCVALWFGWLDALKHFVLRGVLASTGATPLRLPRILDHACRLNLLQRAGGGYLFVHRLLLEHFEATPSARPAEEAR